MGIGTYTNIYTSIGTTLIKPTYVIVHNHMILAVILKHSCIVSRELYALIKHMCEQWIPGPFFEWAWVRGYLPVFTNCYHIHHQSQGVINTHE